jgi:hypothetical protein
VSIASRVSRAANIGSVSALSFSGRFSDGRDRAIERDQQSPIGDGRAHVVRSSNFRHIGDRANEPRIHLVQVRNDPQVERRLADDVAGDADAGAISVTVRPRVSLITQRSVMNTTSWPSSRAPTTERHVLDLRNEHDAPRTIWMRPSSMASQPVKKTRKTIRWHGP